jgi:hypothetical protein
MKWVRPKADPIETKQILFLRTATIKSAFYIGMAACVMMQRMLAVK